MKQIIICGLNNEKTIGLMHENKIIFNSLTSSLLSPIFFSIYVLPYIYIYSGGIQWKRAENEKDKKNSTSLISLK